MKYWLMKTEPTVYGIEQLKKQGFTHWEGVRNYQARNFMRDEMRVGDLVLFYHSNAKPSGVAGICRICREAIPDSTAWNHASTYFDPKSKLKSTVWVMVEVEFVEEFPHFVSLQEMRHFPELNDMLLLKKGSRLSIQPVLRKHFEFIQKIGHQITV